MKTENRVALAALITVLVWILLGALSMLCIAAGVPSALCALVQSILILIAAHFIGKVVI